MGKRGESLVGKQYKLNCGATAEIISDEINRDNLIIKILENGELIYNVVYSNLKKGGVKPKFLPNIFNVGYLGNTDTVIDESTGEKKDEL